MFNVSIREYFSVLNVFIVCIRNTARSKSIPLMCTHVDSYKFSTVHPPRLNHSYECGVCFLNIFGGKVGRKNENIKNELLKKLRQTKKKQCLQLGFNLLGKFRGCIESLLIDGCSIEV
jgi:hypothetical protein